MTFTIPAFWCGVIATVLTEAAVLFALAAKNAIENKRKKSWHRK